MTNALAGVRDFWTVKNRLVLGYAIEILLTILLGGYAVTRLWAIREDAVRLSRESLKGISLINQIDSQVGKIYLLTLKHSNCTNEVDADRLLREMQQELEIFNHAITQFEETVVTTQERTSLEAMRAMRAAYAAASLQTLTHDLSKPWERSEMVVREVEPVYRRFHETVKVAVELKRSQGEASSSQIQTAVVRAEAGIIGGICTSVLVVIFSGYFLVRAINQPLLGVARAMDSMRQGDFTGRLKADRRDEFGEIAEGFNQMAESLNSLVSQVQESGIVVNSSAKQLAITAKQHESTAQETAATTVEIGATAKEISETSQDLVSTVKEVAQVAEQTTTMAGNGQSGLLRMQETMVQVMSAAGTISGKLTVLNEKAGSISQVVTTIAKVADQTNLLSLNAAIEAEKAGEYGRGFSVVATEIRRLADQTAVASHDIEQTVKEMQTAVSAGVMSVDKFSEEVRRGVQEVNQVGSQLNDIIRHVQALTPRFESVNEGMQMHAVGAQQISAALIQLGDSTQQTVQSLRQSNAIIERLNEATSMLRNAVSQFKLDSAVGVPYAPQPLSDLQVRRNSDVPETRSKLMDA